MTQWIPSLNALRAFEAMARHLNYRLAADELGVTPAAVKQLVAKLEAALGVALLERKGRGLVLTPVGAAGCDDLMAAFGRIGDAVGKMRKRDSRQRLIVSVESSFAAAWLVPRLETFRSAHPDIDVLIDSTPHIVDLYRDAVDIAIRYAVKSAEGLVVHRLYDDWVCAFGSPSLVNGAGLNSLVDLNKVTVLHWDIDLQWASATKRWMEWKQWLSHLGADHIVPGEGLRFNDYNLAVQAAIAGQGLVLGSAPILRDAVEAGLLVNPFAESVLTDIGYDLVTTAQAQARPEVANFCAWIFEEVMK